MNTGERIARVRELLSVAKRLADPRDPGADGLVRALVATTGLSAEGVALGLARHLETDATDAELHALVASAGQAPRVWVVLSANVFVAPVRALALAVAASDDVRVRPSRRDPVLTARLHAADGAPNRRPLFTLVSEIEPNPGDLVHLYGRDETIARIRATFPSFVHVREHGHGFGVGVVDATHDQLDENGLSDCADRLAWDVAVFDQRGCLSPRVVLVAARGDLPERFAAALARALEAREREIPRGELDDHEKREAALYRDTLAATGTVLIGKRNASGNHSENQSDATTFVVGTDIEAHALFLPPPGRHVHVVGVRDPAHLVALVSPFRRAITTIGHAADGPLLAAARRMAPGARAVPFGSMQRPPLDGPVDKRTSAGDHENDSFVL